MAASLTGARDMRGLRPAGGGQPGTLLADLRLLAEDRPGPGDIWATKRLASLPPGIRKDVQPWLDQIRHGDARHRPKAAGTWRGYCTAIMPILLAWAPHHDTLPVPARIEAQDLAPMPMRPDEWLVTVLIRHHALPGTTIAGLALDDIDLDRATLTAAGHRRPLDPLTKDAIISYLAYRTRRWPLTANRHLLLSRLSALQDGPVSPWWISHRISRWKSTMTELRQDRILEEAAATAATRDPMHIAMMFGLHPNTAQRYVDAAHGRHDPAPQTVAAGTAGRKGPSDLNTRQYSNS